MSHTSRPGDDRDAGFFRGTHTWLPNGLGTGLIRGLEYFGRGDGDGSQSGDQAGHRAEDQAATGASTS